MVSKTFIEIFTAHEPTERQAEVLEFIKAFYRAYGVPPTIREVMNHFGFRSPNGVMAHFHALEKKGLLRQTHDGGWHSWIPVVPEGCCPCCGREL